MGYSWRPLEIPHTNDVHHMCSKRSSWKIVSLWSNLSYLFLWRWTVCDLMVWWFMQPTSRLVSWNLITAQTVFLINCSLPMTARASKRQKRALPPTIQPSCIPTTTTCTHLLAGASNWNFLLLVLYPSDSRVTALWGPFNLHIQLQPPSPKQNPCLFTCRK